MSDGEELVTLKTRVPRKVADAMGARARAADRSLAAELRQAIDHYERCTNNFEPRKDGAK